MQNSILFVLDGKIETIDFENSLFKPTTTVLNFLRSLHNHKGVKEGCAEGDCGACTVVLAELTANNDLSYKAIDSCLFLLPMLHGKQLITVENLAEEINGKKVLHPVQQALVEHYGSQCGYCTPGIVMSMFALYKNFSNPTQNEILDALTGNLCRCTGYQAIIDAANSPLLQNKQDHFEKNKNQIIQLLQTINKQRQFLTLKSKQQTYFIPFSINEATNILAENTDALLLSGSTDIALRITKKHEILPKIIDLSQVEDIKYYRKTTDNIEIGAGLPLEHIRKICEKDLPSLYEMLCVFGAKQIRNVATLGGNLGSASPIGDTLPILFAYNADIILANKNGKRIVNINDYIVGYRQTVRKPDELIVGVIIPKFEGKIKSYKFSKRKDLDISTVSACFALKLTANNLIEHIVLAYGGVAATTLRAKKAEQFLLNKSFDINNIQAAAKIIYDEFSPISDARSGEIARRIAARNLLLKFFSDMQS